MKMRIDLRPLLTDPLHGVRIVLYIVCAAIALGPLQQSLLSRISIGDHMFSTNLGFPPAQPPLIAGGVEVGEGILQYSGGTARGVWNAPVISVMMSMVFVYLVGPSLLVWGFRARARYRMKDPSASGATKIAVALAVGGFSVLSLLPGLGVAYSSRATHEIIVADNEASRELDCMATSLSLMARKAQVAYFVAGEPWQLAGSWQMSDGSKQPVLSIVQLIEPGVDAVIADSRHAVIDGRAYELVVERADSLTIKGECAAAHPKMSSLSGEREASMPGMCVGVTPYKVNMVLWE